MDGVLDARFSYEEGSGWVAYDPARVTPDEVIDELGRMTGFVGRVRDDRPAAEAGPAGPEDAAAPHGP
ncbi:MAG: hypothetical protein D6701_14520 [Gemmatimonadetes bacterium]|nr:MAG: hypothetical protein D6701_14520 [Gemmatimonadota bacterium]